MFLFNAKKHPAFSKCTKLPLDIEATNLLHNKGQVRLIQLMVDGMVYIYDPSCYDVSFLKEALENPAIIKIIHNAIYECTWLYHHYGWRIKSVHDTLLTERILKAGLTELFSLDKILEARYCITNDWNKKEMQLSFTVDEPFTYDQLRYSCEDVIHLERLYIDQMDELLAENLLEAYKLDMRMIQPVSSMKLNGISVDMEQWNKNIDSARNHVKNLKAKLLTELGDINLNSPKQLLPKLIDKTGIDLKNTDRNKTLQYHQSNSVISDLIEYKKWNKLVTSFGDNIHEYIENGKLFPSFRINGAVTSRMSCANPNLQQIPRNQEYRKAFISDPGHTLLIADFEGQELCILIQALKLERWEYLLQQGYDLHSYFASHLFSEWEEVSEPGCTFPKKCSCPQHKEFRQKSKNMVFALSYGGGVNAVVSQTHFSTEQARDVINKFFKLYPEVKEGLDKCSLYAEVNGFITGLAPIKRKRFWKHQSQRMYLGENDKWLDPLYTQSRNFPIQSTGSDILKLAVVDLWEMHLDIRFLAVIHDEIILMAPEDTAGKLLPIVKKSMEDSALKVIPSGILKVDAKYSKVWTK
jgi:DNA polymerase I-like protein with 3'-5' exonuclease and polymerase domains